MSSNMIPEGYHRAKAVSAQMGETKNGKEQVLIDFELLAEDVKGRRIGYYGYFTDGTWERTEEALKNCGWEGSYKDFSGVTKNEVTIVVEHETWEGKTRAKVQFVNSLNKPKLAAPMSDDKIRQFEAKMAARRGGSVVPAAAREEDKSELPF